MPSADVIEIRTEGKELVQQEHVPAVTEPLLDKLMAAFGGGMDINVLEKFMDLAERQQKREAEQAFNASFADFTANPPVLTKSNEAKYNGKTQYIYASLGDITGPIATALSLHGLSFRWTFAIENGLILVTCYLMHVDGHSISASLSAAADNSGKKNSIQAVASTVSYLEKYTLLAVTGLSFQGQDDDGQSHQDPVEPKQTQKPAKKQAEKPKQEPVSQDREAIEQWLTYIDSFTDKSLDVFNTWREADKYSKLQAWFENNNPAQGEELKIAVREMEQYLMEKETSK